MFCVLPDVLCTPPNPAFYSHGCLCQTRGEAESKGLPLSAHRNIPVFVSCLCYDTVFIKTAIPIATIYLSFQLSTLTSK